MKQTIHHNRLKRLAIGISIMILTLPISAQGTAEIWLNKAAEKLRNKGTEITFRIHEEGVRINGKLLMDGEKFLYDTDEMKIWYDGLTQWTLQIGDDYNELYINNPSLEEQRSINPYVLLNSYKEHFTITDGGEKKHDDKLVHMVTLSSKDTIQRDESFNIYITSDGDLALLELIAPNGQLYKIDIHSMRNALTFPRETFAYPSKDYPADEIIDMR